MAKGGMRPAAGMRKAAMRYEKSAADRKADAKAMKGGAGAARGMARKDTSFVKKMEDSDIEV